MASFQLSPELAEEVNSFSFGCLVDDKTFVNHFRSDSYSQIYYAKTLFANYRKRLQIQFKTYMERPLQTTDPENNGRSCEWFEEKFEFSLNYSQIKSIRFKDNELFLKITFPPLLYAIVDDFQYGQQFDERLEQMDEELETLANGEDSGCETQSVDFFEVRDNPEDNRFDPNLDFYGLRLRTTKLFDIIEDNLTKINSIRIQFKDKTCLSAIVSNLKAFEPLVIIEDKVFQTIDCKSYSIDSSKVFGLPFGVEYSLQALISHSFQLTDCLDYSGKTLDEFVETVKELTQINEKSVENSLNDLRVNIQNNSEIKPFDDLIHSFDNYQKSSEKWTNSSVLMVRRCILTPTRVLLLPALPLQESRFLRIANPEHVIRILIKDEDLQSLSFTAGKSSLHEEHEVMDQINDFLFNIIVKRLSNGISIAGRVYELVGASTSQLRDHGLVLYACDDLNRNALSIRREVGNIDSLRNPAKFVARIGQSMSQSMGFVPNVDCVQMIDDIEGGLNPKTEKSYVFSDGVGMISKEMADELCAALHLNNVSTFQIRYAGFKGILVFNPRLEGRKILMRPSMKKFESSSTDLDVLKASEPRSCYLNRPLITILNQMGVPNDNFLELLYNRHKQLINAFDCECKAIKLMRDYSGLDFNFKPLIDSGIDVLREPFFVQIIESIIRKVSLDLRNKARILIPFDSGRVMYGVLDETRTLTYGQVFVQYSHQKSGTKRVLEGEVLVTKYPCMHAGDVRKLEAVDVPALHHIVDCIVFPAQGERPHPDEMAGSDLDGDEYSVIWYKPMIFPKQNYSPMDFPSGEAEDLGRPVNNEDILRFYCRFIAYNQVGLIAHSHLVWSDDMLFGIKSGLCERLAFKYAVALDYAKTGINSRLRNDQKPKLFPDFMMKSNERPTYKSNKALGKLYQKNCFFHEVINSLAEDKTGFELNRLLIDERAEIHMENARHVFKKYQNSIKDLMEKFGIESESSLLSSTFNKTHKYLTTHNDNNDIYDLVTNIVKRLFNDFLKEFESNVDEEEELLAKASAWYQVSHEINGRRSGFPWIVSKYLAKLALRKGSSKHSCRRNSQIIFNSDKCFPKHKILNVFHKIIRNSEEMIGFSLGFKCFGDSVDNKIQTVLKEYTSDDIPFYVLMQLLAKLTEDINDLDSEYDLAITSLMANMKIKRLGIINALKQEISVESNRVNGSNGVLVMAIGEKLANIIRNYRHSDNPEECLVSNIKKLTAVSQLAIKYGSQGHDSYICVFGSRQSLEKFKHFITQRYIDSKLKNEDFDSTFY